MILIADSGSTKTSWCLIDFSGKTLNFDTEGYNPCYAGCKTLIEILRPNLPENFDPTDVQQVAFYGAGVFDDKHKVIYDDLHPVFPNAHIDVSIDLIGSARALLGHDAGFVAIVGTGSSSCLYDGEKIIHKISSLGFMLGDEGGGGYMGKRLITDYIRGHMPKEVRDCFWDTFQLSAVQLIERIYANPLPNRYCASFTTFLTGKYAGHEYLEQQIICGSFRDFFNRVVKYYPNYQSYSFNCVGSIGWIFRDYLTLVASEFGMETGIIISSPMEGLVNYHLQGNYFSIGVRTMLRNDTLP